jgi:hypothetical protein
MTKILHTLWLDVYILRKDEYILLIKLLLVVILTPTFRKRNKQNRSKHYLNNET